MTLPVSPNSISADQIRTEFGATSGDQNTGPVRLGAYRVKQSVSGLENMPLDTGIPQSGPIKFSDFYNKKLNMVIDYTSTTPVTRVNARTDYNANSRVTVIGGFKTRPDSPTGKKVWIHTNGIVGSDQKNAGRTYSSLLTGTWDSSIDLIVDIGPSARIYGAGGDGGKGGDQGDNGGDGLAGTSALGVSATNNTTIRVASGAIVRGGGGAGGGGGGAVGLRRNRKKDFRTNASGGGGGGGQGYPGGSGGEKGVATDPDTENHGFGSGGAGDAGSLDTAGKGGGGGAGTLGTGCQAFGGGGGGGGFAGGAGSGNSSEGNSSAGGSAGTTSKGGDGGKGKDINSNGPVGSSGEGGKGGPSGYGIIVDTAKTNITYSNNGSVSSEVYSTNPS